MTKKPSFLLNVTAIKASILLGLLMVVSLGSAHSFNCKVKEMGAGSSAPDLVHVTMMCPAQNPIVSGTNGCTAATISSDTVVFDPTSDLGKSYLPMLMAAMMAEKTVMLSAFGTCPVNSPSTPVVYAVRVLSS